ncbi:MAG: N-acetylneuraminate synthase, partial [Thaumarchaeota archaeon]|nr:N-acetylneuraminate synthase [Nitrososphaerota archaeon]
MVFIVAEIGINHNGDINIAKKLIDMAKRTGCDAVKFQKRTIEKVYSKEILDTPRESPWGTTTREQKLGLEFNKKEYDIINDYCKQNNIEWFASAWDVDSQIFLKQYNSKYNKISSAMLTDIDFLKVVAEEKKHTFISTGMSTMDQVRKAVEVFKQYNCPFELMHSNSTYPMKLEEANLRCIETLRKEFNCDVGYSGH